MSEEICGNCKYCFPITCRIGGKWHWSTCCAVLLFAEPVVENDENSFAKIVDPMSDGCGVYTARGSLKPKEEDTGVFME